MDLHVKLIALLFCIVGTGFTNADPSRCYFCSSEADGNSCHNPLERSTSRIQYCGNSTISDNVSGNSAVKATNMSDPAGTYACTTITYTSMANVFVTMRGCQNMMILGQEVCFYLSTSPVTTGHSRNFTCAACYTDLCNSDSSASTVYFSVAVFVITILTTSIF